MRLTSNKRFIVEEFDADQRKWITKLIQPLNAFIEQVFQACTQGLTTKDNLKCQTYTIKIIPGQTYPIKQAYGLNEKPMSCLLTQVIESTGAVPSSAWSLYWNYTSSLELTPVGLDPTKTYTLTIIAQV